MADKSPAQGMRISELSAATDVPVARIKYYIREGLLPRGTGEGTQTVYDASHAHRLGLIRALVTIGGIGISDARVLIGMTEATSPRLDETLAATMGALGRRDAAQGMGTDAAAAQIEALIAARGWHIHEDDPARDTVVAALSGLQLTGLPRLDELLDAYTDAAESIARKDLEAIADADAPARLIEMAVVGTVLGERLFGGLRRLAHAARGVERYGDAGSGDADTPGQGLGPA